MNINVTTEQDLHAMISNLRQGYDRTATYTVDVDASTWDVDDRANVLWLQNHADLYTKRLTIKKLTLGEQPS